ncbi:uncharacterized protein LOC108145953 [Drosophila elegans]|uniref:uncharacterized protein LOC108145953 n=1 Tax=Drosophila elegans TaxID=30023 RepID=UPI0007E5D893|nr:uncharacterized protein LOC108145953 [Drosophila elegans]
MCRKLSKTLIDLQSSWIPRPQAPRTRPTFWCEQQARQTKPSRRKPRTRSLRLRGSALTSPNAVWDFKRVGPMSSWVYMQPSRSNQQIPSLNPESYQCGEQRTNFWAEMQQKPGHRQFVAGRDSLMSIGLDWIGLDCQRERELEMTDGTWCRPLSPTASYFPAFPPWGAIVREAGFWFLKNTRCLSMGVSQRLPLILWPKRRSVRAEDKKGK